MMIHSSLEPWSCVNCWFRTPTLHDNVDQKLSPQAGYKWTKKVWSTYKSRRMLSRLFRIATRLATS